MNLNDLDTLRQTSAIATTPPIGQAPVQERSDAAMAALLDAQIAAACERIAPLSMATRTEPLSAMKIDPPGDPDQRQFPIFCFSR